MAPFTSFAYAASLQGDHLGLPVSPYYKDAAVFVKHKSVEGGMGIHVYKYVAAAANPYVSKHSNHLMMPGIICKHSWPAVYKPHPPLLPP